MAAARPLNQRQSLIAFSAVSKGFIGRWGSRPGMLPWSRSRSSVPPSPCRLTPTRHSGSHRSESPRPPQIAVHPQHAGALAVPLRPESVDLIYMVTVLGELTDPALALREMHAALKPGGFLAIAEQLPDPDYVSRTRVRMLCEEAGLAFVKVDGAWWSFVATFQRPRASR